VVTLFEYRSFRNRVLEGQPIGGVWLNLGSPDATEIACLAGHDWLLIDLEHGSGGLHDLKHQLWAAQAGQSAPVVRVASLNEAEIKRVLDLRPAGVMIPNVQDSAQAAQAVQAVRIPPVGERGAATSTRASAYGYGYNDYLSDANESVLLVVQIECRKAVEDARRIAALQGIDVLFVGPVDLSTSLGGGDPRAVSPELFEQSLRVVAEACAAAGKAAGILARSAEQAAKFRQMGFTFIAMGSDRGILASGFRRNAEALKAVLSAPAVSEV
jgi:2-keto-3-deoxy-L-rhamnonate aldolase RhmA